ncbi:tRNA-dihydrouridine-20 synthase [Aureococcus anophagefferens]|nr:tRNA-dihydrouridine-20 synthase [Aureococcus anophagefferens]
MTDDVVRLWPPKPNATTPIKCLGPMVRANSTALRILALESGADMVYSEELIARRMEVTQFRLNETLGTADWLDANGKSVALRVDPARERGASWCNSAPAATSPGGGSRRATRAAWT